MSIYARNTSVSVEKSKGEIEEILARYGATGFAYATQADKAMIQFHAESRRIMFVLNLPDPKEKKFTHGHKNLAFELHPDDAFKKWEQACRQIWRCLALAIKAKLEAVESGIATFEDEFMAHIVLPGGKTVGQMMKPQIQTAYETGKMPPLLGLSHKP